MYTNCKVVCSRLRERFFPHLVPGYRGKNLEQRIIGLPDQGGRIELGRSYIQAVPAHFLHSVGNFHFYDPISRILFSGDLGASLVDEEPSKPVDDFQAHVPTMEGFHRRYMVSNRACRLWANMARRMDIEMIVPQHGRPLKETLNNSRVPLAAQRARRQGALRRAVVILQPSSATLAASALCGPLSASLADSVQPEPASLSPSRRSQAVNGAPERRPGMRWRSCKGLRPFTANAALPGHRSGAQRLAGIVQRFLKGKAMVNTFIDWIAGLECGVDLMTEADFKAA